jgi:hypothetical protein
LIHQKCEFVSMYSNLYLIRGGGKISICTKNLTSFTIFIKQWFWDPKAISMLWYANFDSWLQLRDIETQHLQLKTRDAINCRFLILINHFNYTYFYLFHNITTEEVAYHNNFRKLLANPRSHGQILYVINWYSLCYTKILLVELG